MEKEKKKPWDFTSVTVALAENQGIFEKQEKEDNARSASIHHAAVTAITDCVSPWLRPSNLRFPETSISSSANKAPS